MIDQYLVLKKRINFINYYETLIHYFIWFYSIINDFIIVMYFLNQKFQPI